MVANTYKTLEAKNLARERVRLHTAINKKSKTQNKRFGLTPKQFIDVNKKRLLFVESRLKYLGYE